MKQQRVVIFRCGQLGDTIVALPALWSIRAFFGDAEITFLADHHPNSKYVPARSVLPESGLVDDWMTYDARSRLVDLIQLSLALRRRAFTDLVYLVPSRRSASQRQRDELFFRASGIGRIWGNRGFESPPERRYPLSVETPESRVLLRRLQSAGIAPVYRYDLGLTHEERSDVLAWLKSRGLGDCERIIAVAPGTKAPSKQWPMERFSAVLKHLHESRGLVPVIVGGREDADLGNWICQDVGSGVVAAGTLGVRATGALMERALVFLGNDTGAMHLAAAAKTPCIVPFSAQDWRGRWFPAGCHHRVLRVDIECEGCQLTQCPRNNECLTRISVDDVIAEAELALDRVQRKLVDGSETAVEE